jgi:hypothetical protein
MGRFYVQVGAHWRKGDLDLLSD